MKSKKILCTLAFVAVVSQGFFLSMTHVQAATSQTVTTHRLAGESRYDTSIAISQGGWDKSDTVILTSGDKFADALCAGPLAKKYKAPILLTTSTSINDNTLKELARLQAKNIILIGGAASISTNVEEKLKAAGYTNIDRIGGKDRYETSAMIAKKLDKTDKVVIASGESFPDALSVSAVASKLGMPILLSSGNSLSEDAKEFIKNNDIKETYIVGGEGVLSSIIEKSVPSPIRLGGANRYATNLAVIKQFEKVLNFDNIYLTLGDGPTGDEFADALSGAALACNTSSPMLITNKSIDNDMNTYIKSKLNLNTKVIALGGQTVVPDTLIKTVMDEKTVAPVTKIYDKAGTYSDGEINGSVTISASDVYLKNTTIKGDLLIASTVNDGNIDLDNVVVTGKTIINGGGAHSVRYHNGTAGNIHLDKPIGEETRVVIYENANIDSIVVESNGILDETKATKPGNVTIEQNSNLKLIGKFNNVEIKGKDSNVTIENGTVGTLKVEDSAKNSTINVAKNSSVQTVAVKSEAAITGEGEINKVSVEAQGVNVKVGASNVNSLEVTKEAKGSVVNLDGNAKVNTLTLNGAADIKGQGEIKNASVNVEGTTIEKKPTNISIEKGVTTTVTGNKETGTAKRDDSSHNSSSSSNSTSPSPAAPIAFTVNQPTSADNAVNGDGKSNVTINWTDSTTTTVDHYEIVAKVGSVPAVTDVVSGLNNIAKGTQTATFPWNAGEDVYVGVVAVDANGLKTLCKGNTGNVTVAADRHTPVAASGMTAATAAKATPEANKVMLTVSTGVSDTNHKVYYRVVDTDPSAMNVGEVIIPANWTEVADTSAHEITAADGKFVEVVEVTASDNKVTRWGKSAATNDGYTAPVAASGITAATAAKATPEANKVMLTVSTGASDANHKVYYRVVDASPSAMNVGEVITPANWTEVADTSAHEITAADGKFVEVVEVTTADNKVTRWGKSAATDDGYTAATSIVVQNLNDSGTGSLRQAIANIESGGTITFGSELSGEIKLQSCINISKNVKITGPADGNVTISGENSYRIFNIDSGKNVEISYFKFTKGSDNAYLDDPNDENNYGGAIHNAGNLTINYAEFNGNNAFCSGGAVTTWENSTLTVNNSTFSNNNAGRIAYGGAIYAYLNSNVSINNSTFNGNSATNQGFGGAIWIESGNLTLNSTTISGNTASTGGGICGGTQANITLKNTIVSDNGTEDIRGSVKANYSLISTTTGCAFSINDNNITGQSANLGSLADNGGVTKTMMPNAGSPVIDAGDDSGIAETDTDQRGTGNLRKKGTHVDIGAVETGTSVVAASGMTASTAAKATPEANKVMLTVSTGASDVNHKVYYRVVDAAPSAMNVGEVITPANWAEVADTSAHEITAADGKYVEVVEVTAADNKVTRWGKSAATDDGYTAPVAANGMTAAIAAKATPEANKVMLTVSTGASDVNHKVYYRVVDASPSAMNVGAVITTSEWKEVADTSAHEIAAVDGKYVEVVEVTTADNKVTRWGKSGATDDGYTAPVAASGMTVATAAKTTAEENKVMLTVSTGASDANHKVYYKVVDAAPSAMNVGTVITTSEWTEVADTSAHEITAADGKYVEVVEVTIADNKVTRWGKSGATDDGYTAPVAASGMTVATAAKTTAEENKIMLTVSTGASDANHKVYYKVVDAAPSAMNVGTVITTSEWTEVADTSAHEITAADGKYVEVVEVTTADKKVTRWGKSGATNDGYTAISSIVVTSLADSGSGSLRDAITNAHDGDTITFSDSLSGTINLESTLPKIERNIKIVGPSSKNVDISGNSNYQIFDIGLSATVEISNLNLKNASDANNDPSSNNCSGAIYNQGSLTINSVNFSDNVSSLSGGAIQSEQDSTLVVNNSNFNRNSATSSTGSAFAGAIYAYYCNTTINNCTFNNNLAQGQGGAIYLECGKITISNSTFDANSAGGGGADIAISAATDADGFINTNNTFHGDILDNRNKN